MTEKTGTHEISHQPNIILPVSDLQTIFITHDIDVIAEIANRVNVIYASKIVETPPGKETFTNPKHPYTQGLLESILGRNVGEARLQTIERDMLTPNEPPTYCRFPPRYPEQFVECETVHSVSVPVNETADAHAAACLLYPEDRSREDAVETHRTPGEQETSR